MGPIRVRWAFLFSAVVLVACSSSSSDSASSGVGGNGDCADGFSPDPAGDGCVEILPAGDCPAGTRAALGSTTCLPIATLTCGAGFAPDPSGWGCLDITPASDCAAGTIEELGQSTCQPIDDCNAAFPPAGATYFVDDDTVTPDATHFKTIDAAIAAAPTGATIAVEAGTYVEGVETHKPLSIVGRCAAQVKVQSPGGMLAGFQAINVSGKVSVSGLSLSGFRGGVVAQNGDVTIADCDIRGSQQSGVVAIGGTLHVSHTRVSGTVQGGDQGFGFFLSDSANVTLDRVAAIKNPISGIVANSKAVVKISRSISANNGPNSSGKGGAGVALDEAATMTIDASALYGNRTDNAECYDAGTSLKITGSVLRGSIADNFHNHGDGIALDDAASIDVDGSTVSGNAESGLIVIGPGTTAHVTNTVFSGGPENPQRGVGVSGGATAELDGVVVAHARDYGILAQDSGSTLTVTGSLVRDVVRTSASDVNSGDGMQIAYGATLTMTDSSIVNATQIGLGMGGTDATGSGGNVTLTKVLISKAIANESGNFGRGVQATDGATLVATGCAFLDNQETAIVIGVNASANIKDSVLRRSGMNGPTKFGYGAVVVSGGMLALESCAVRDNLGVGLAFDSSSGTVDNGVVAHNAIGIFASNATLNDVATLPPSAVPQQVFVAQTRFVDNGTRVSSEDIPLPEVIQ